MICFLPPKPSKRYDHPTRYDYTAHSGTTRRQDLSLSPNTPKGNDYSRRYSLHNQALLKRISLRCMTLYQKPKAHIRKVQCAHFYNIKTKHVLLFPKTMRIRGATIAAMHNSVGEEASVVLKRGIVGLYAQAALVGRVLK